MSIMVSITLAAAALWAAPQDAAPHGAVTEVLPPIVQEAPEFEAIPRLRRGSAAPVVAEFLSSTNTDTRLRGIEAIEDLHSPVQVETLLKALHDDSNRVQLAAARRLADAPPSIVIGLVWDPSIERPGAFWTNFWRHAPDWKGGLADPLHEFLQRDDIAADQAALAAFALGLMRHGPSGEVLARRAWVQHRELAYRSSEALLRLGEAGPREEQRRLLRHPMPEVRHIAVYAVAQHGDQGAMDALREVVLGRSERSLVVRKAAVSALATMEYRTVLPVLIELMQQVPSLNWEIRQALVHVAGVDNGRTPGVWREWYEALLLFEAGRVEEANRKLEALQSQRSLRLR